MILSKLSISYCSLVTARYYTCFHLKAHSHRTPYYESVHYQQLAAFSSRKNAAPGPAKVGQLKRIKKNVLEYGIVGCLFHLSTSILMFGSCYLIVTKFGEIEGALETFKSPDAVYAAPGLNFIVSLGLFKSLFPIRLSATCVGTWSIVRYYRCRKEKKKALVAKELVQKL
ncbi:hypothetical protein ACHWQZ_G007276 [Mnemiopsis leidyi]